MPSIVREKMGDDWKKERGDKRIHLVTDRVSAEIEFVVGTE